MARAEWAARHARAAGALAAGAAMMLLPPPSPAVCPGDCDGNGAVSVAELVRCVGLALADGGGAQACAACDPGGDGVVRVEDLVLAAACGTSGCDDAAGCFVPARVSPTFTPPPPTPTPPAGWHFEEISRQAGVARAHRWDARFVTGLRLEAAMFSGGVAAGDFDGDGWVDLFVVGGQAPDRLYRNNGDGTFTDVAPEAGLARRGAMGCGPAFADLDGDGDLDLFVGAAAGGTPRFYRNRGDGTFEDVSDRTGYPLDPHAEHFGAAFADIDADGDLDMAVAHWGTVTRYRIPLLWRNNGDGSFTEVPLDDPPGIDAVDFTFSPTFADIDADGWPDLLVTGDFGTSRIYRNRMGVFVADRETPLTDENGMGAAVADYDGDGDLDWFVSSIWDPNGVAEANWGVTGNRLYRNRGNGTFEDATDQAGVREGFWGWGACFADFDNNGVLDLFHTNGFGRMDLGGRPRFGKDTEEFWKDPSRLFVGRGDGSFEEQSERRGLHDVGQGRGIVCFDYDRDGDIDIFVMNNGQPPRLYRSHCPDCGHFAGIRLRGSPPNTEAVGARIWLRAGGRTRLRELHLGNNFASHNPVEAHFGLGSARRIDQVEVWWPDGQRTSLRALPVDTWLEIRHPDLTAAGEREWDLLRTQK